MGARRLAGSAGALSFYAEWKGEAQYCLEQRPPSSLFGRRAQDDAGPLPRRACSNAPEEAKAPAHKARGLVALSLSFDWELWPANRVRRCGEGSRSGQRPPPRALFALLHSIRWERSAW